MAGVLLVVSRYNEDVGWTREFDRKIIYNKGDRNTIPKDLQDYVIDLPNVGREVHTYLHHIIENYDNLDPLTIFVQGGYKDHYKNIPPERFKQLFSNVKSGYSTNFFNTETWGDSRRAYNFNLSFWGGRDLGNRDLKYGMWFERVFSERYIDSPFAYAWSIFSVDKEHIQRRPNDFYKALIKHVDYHNSPQEAHFMERSWLQLFKIEVKQEDIFEMNKFL